MNSPATSSTGTAEAAAAFPRVSQKQPGGFPWLFSAAIDLWTFGGSAALSLLLLAAGAPLGLLHSEAPEWTWITCVLLIDVAHVYATGFRVYFDRQELVRRPGLYFGTPAACFAVGWAIHSENPATYWRLLAYLAVFHFVRQQYGWVMLYRAKAGETGTWSRRLDAVTIYLATIHPLAVWHANLPRQFRWMIDGDFAALPAWIPWVTGPLWAASLAAYGLHSLERGWRHGTWNPGKDLVVFTTALCWYVGIVTFNSDYAFTVTNVVIHGVPYFVIVFLTWQRTAGGNAAGARPVGKSLAMFLGAVWMLAFVEELLWDRGVWEDRGHLFGGSWRLPNPGGVLAPLLGVPQLTHYVLDGFIWKRARNRAVTQSLDIDREAPLQTATSATRN